MVGSWLTLWLLVANVAAAAQGGWVTRDEALAAVFPEAVVEAVRSGQVEHPQLSYFARLPEAEDADREALVAFLERPDRGPLTAELLGAVDVPVLVVLGERDDAGPAEPLLDALPDARLVLLPGVDHFATPKDFGFIDAALGFIDALPF